MSSILRPGYVRWDGLKYVLDPDIEIVGPPGLPGPAGSNGTIGADGDATLIYQPGGTQTGNIYSSWTDLMAKRATITSPMTVVIDDSITSPAPIDVGTWDLTHNTRLIGANGEQREFNFGVLQLTQLLIPDGAQLLDPNEFRYLNITGSSTALPSIETNGVDLLNFDAWTCIFNNGGNSAVPLIHTLGGVINLYGSCHIISSNSPSFIIQGNDGYLTLNVNDQSVVDGYSLKLDPTIHFLVNISGGGFFSNQQQGISVAAQSTVQQNPVQASPRDNFTSVNPNLIVVRPPGFLPPIATNIGGAINFGSEDPGFSYQNGQPNTQGVNADFATVLGGTNNDIDTGCVYCVIAGGSGNIFNTSGGSPTWGYIAGRDNLIEGDSQFSAIIGGENNHINAGTTCFILARNSSIQASSSNCVIVGGDSLNIQSNSSRSILAGGVENTLQGGQGNGVFAGQNNSAGAVGLVGAVVLGGDLNNASNESCAVVSGEQNNATGEFSVVVGGNQNTASGQGALIAGSHGSTVSGTNSAVIGGSSNQVLIGQGSAVLGGNSNTNNGNNSSLLAGEGSVISADFSVILGGNFSTTTGSASAVLAGTSNTAGGTNSVVMGSNGNTFRQSQFSHAGGTLSGVPVQFGRYLVKGQTSNATPLNLLDLDAIEFHLENGKAYSIKATCIANRTGTAGRAMFIHTLLAHQSSGTAVIDNDNTTLTVANGQAWTIAFTTTGSILRATFTGTVGQTVNVLVNYEWSEVGGGA